MTAIQQRFYAKPPAVQQVIRLYMAHKDLADGISAADLTFESVDRETEAALEMWDAGMFVSGGDEEAQAIQCLEALQAQEDGWRNAMAPASTGRLECGVPIKRKK